MASRTQSRLSRLQYLQKLTEVSASTLSILLLKQFPAILFALLFATLIVPCCYAQKNNSTNNPAVNSAVNAASANSSLPLIDGTVRDGALLSIDKAIVVGDANAILVTQDAGKNWRNIQSRSNSILYAIGFDDTPARNGARAGLIVGGYLEPETGRSVGSILTSDDEGLSWQSITTSHLPRLIGIQRIKHHHWIAWGDWSNHHNSSLFETIDGGRTWSPRPVPCGHLQAVSISPEGKTLLVDRSGRVFFAEDGIEFRTLNIESDPFRPIRFCSLQPQGWWIGGDAGRLLHSLDGINWHSVPLPIPPNERNLVDLYRLEGYGSKLWIVGNPGSVLWTSDDHGANWTMLPTGSQAPLQGIKAANEQVLMAWGGLAHILHSRNAGGAWKISHRAANRLLCLSITATEEEIPWDALAYLTHETQHQSGALVVHDRRFTEVLHQEIDRSSALECLAPSLRLNHLTTYRAYPISNMPNGFKASDLAYYQTYNEELLRKLVLEIRTHRPDLIITGDPSASDTLESAHASLVTQAVQQAGNPAYHPLPNLKHSTIPPWTVQRIVQRCNQKNGLSLSSSMLLKSSNRLLGQVLQDCRRFYAHQTFAPSLQIPQALCNKTQYRVLYPKGLSISHPTDGLVIRDDSKLAERFVDKANLQLLMASANAQPRVAQLLQTRGSDLYRERAWDDALVETLKPLASDTALDVLWMISQESRVQGNWHRWHTALQTILQRYPQDRYQELALRELMTYTGSAEVQRLIDSQLASKTEVFEPSESPNPQSGSIASPFSNSENQVITASAIVQPKRTPIAQGNSEREFAKHLGAWPETWAHKKSEPAWSWLIASRFRTSSLSRTGVLNPSAERSFWPSYTPQLGNWAGIFEQERIVQGPPEGSLPLPRIPWLQQRPHLDGQAESEPWKDALTMPLSTAWADENLPSTIRIFRDHEFLFIHALHPRNRASEIVAEGNKTKKAGRQIPKASSNKRDSLDPLIDHTRLRIDIDRDYATWFEFAWDIQGGVSDRCNDMAYWNPEWFIATHQTSDTWAVEVAIPIASLVSNAGSNAASNPFNTTASNTTGELQVDAPSGSQATAQIDWSNQVWAISFTHQRPSLSTEFLVAGDSDCWGHDQWLLMDARNPPAVQQARTNGPGAIR